MAITREKAIEKLKLLRNNMNFAEVFEEALDMAIEALSERTGEWMSNHDGSWNCSECGLRVFVYAKGNFCPNCGADMREKIE